VRPGTQSTDAVDEWEQVVDQQATAPAPGFWEAYTDGFRQYASFTGRTSRAGFWRFIAVDVAVLWGPVLLAAPFAGGQDTSQPPVDSPYFWVNMFFWAYSLAGLLPRLAIGARRLHDTGRSAMWLLLLLALPVGWIVLIVFAGEDTKPLDSPYAAAGWHRDPSGTSRLRYWNGATWTEHYAPVPDQRWPAPTAVDP